MDSGSILRPLPGAAPLPVRADVAPVKQAVRTDLPQAVQANAATEQARFGKADRYRSQLEREAERRALDRLSKGFATDDQTGELVYRAIDAVTGAIVSQTPEEAILRLRAYLSSVEARGADNGDDAPTA